MAADPSVVEALGQIDLFSSLTRKSLKLIASQVKVVNHTAGKEITEQDKSGVGFHLITAGTASVSVNGKERPDLKPGQYFGEIALIDGLPRSATVTAKTDMTTIALVPWVFRPMLDEEPGIAKGLLDVMCARLRAAEHR